MSSRILLEHLSLLIHLPQIAITKPLKRQLCYRSQSCYIVAKTIKRLRRKLILYFQKRQSFRCIDLKNINMRTRFYYLYIVQQPQPTLKTLPVR